MNSILDQLLTAIVILITSMIVHEQGHYTKAKKLGYKSSVGLDRHGLYTEFPNDVKRSDHLLILKQGIIWGALVTLATPLFSLAFTPLVMICYLMGCRKDLKQIKELTNGNKKL